MAFSSAPTMCLVGFKRATHYRDLNVFSAIVPFRGLHMYNPSSRAKVPRLLKSTPLPLKYARSANLSGNTGRSARALEVGPLALDWLLFEVLPTICVSVCVMMCGEV